MPVTLKTNSFKYKDDPNDSWSAALVQATASLEPAFQDIGKLASELGIVVNGNTAAVNIAAGQYIILKNSTIFGKEDGLYVAANAVSAGTALQSTDIPAAAITNGGLNALNDNIEIQSFFTPTQNRVAVTSDAYCYKMGNIVFLMFDFISKISGSNAIGSIVSNICPKKTIYFMCVDYTDRGKAYPLAINTSGIITAYNISNEHEYFATLCYTI